MAHTLKTMGDQIIEKVPRKRIGEPSDMAGAAIFFVVEGEWLYYGCCVAGGWGNYRDVVVIRPLIALAHPCAPRYRHPCPKGRTPTVNGLLRPASSLRFLAATAALLAKTGCFADLTIIPFFSVPIGRGSGYQCDTSLSFETIAANTRNAAGPQGFRWYIFVSIRCQ